MVLWGAAAAVAASSSRCRPSFQPSFQRAGWHTNFPVRQPRGGFALECRAAKLLHEAALWPGTLPSAVLGSNVCRCDEATGLEEPEHEARPGVCERTCTQVYDTVLDAGCGKV